MDRYEQLCAEQRERLGQIDFHQRRIARLIEAYEAAWKEQRELETRDLLQYITASDGVTYGPFSTE